MTSNETDLRDAEAEADTLSIGRRIRFFRKQRGLTLTELGEKVGRAASQISTIENGKRETSVTLLSAIAKALHTEVAELIDPTPVDGRQALELEAERNQASPMYSALGLPQVRIKSLPARCARSDRGSAEPARPGSRTSGRDTGRGPSGQPGAAREDEARRTTTSPTWRPTAAELLRLADYESGTVSQRQTAMIAEKLGFSLHYVSDLPEFDPVDLRYREQPSLSAQCRCRLRIRARISSSASPPMFSAMILRRTSASSSSSGSRRTIWPRRSCCRESAAVPMLVEEKTKA